jgi:hypothetical protein
MVRSKRDQRIIERITEGLFHTRNIKYIRDKDEFEKTIFALTLKGYEFDEEYMRELFRREYNFYLKMKRQKKSYKELHEDLRKLLS